MTELVFYEKPGCVGNQRQKALLRSVGVQLVIRDLLNEHWTAERLRAYFGSLPVADWFNLSAPSVKSGELAIEELNESQALVLMLDDPLLIRRPLMKLGDIRQSGFVKGPVLERAGVSLKPETDLQTCPAEGTDPVCGEPS